MILSIAVLAGTPSFFVDVAALLVAGAVIAFVGYRLGFLPIVGFLLAGVVIGPNALGLVRDPALVDAAAEVGVILLLFTIGIEFSLEKLSRIRRLILVGGGLQVVLATIVSMGLVVLFGRDWRAGLFTGFLVALSSTAIVLKLLGDKGETQSEQGQISLALLIFQDLAIIAMVLVVPILGGAGGSSLEIVWALGKAGALILAVLLIARRVMPRVLEAVARTCSPELFLLTVIAICFGTAYLTSLAGVSLSLGAFLAGLIVSESSFSEHALGEILPLQILFSATFFVSVGMLLDPSFLIGHLPLVLGALVLVVAVKVLTTGASVLALGYKLPVAASAGLLLAQVGEFSFVLERAGRDVGLYPAGLAESGSQAFIAATVLLMVLTPVLAQLGDRVGAGVARHEREILRVATEESQVASTAAFESLSNHVVVAGFGTAARRLVRVLEQARLPFVITTLSPVGAEEAEREGFPVLRGDSSRMRTLQLVGADRAKMLVIADDDPAMARRIAAVGRTLNPTMRIIVRTRHLSETAPLAEVGADVVITEEVESIVQVFGEILRGYRIDPAQVEGYEETIRRGGYRVLEVRGPAGPALRACDLDDECLDTRAVTVRAGAAAVGKSIGELELDREGIHVAAVRSNGGEEMEAEPGIVLAAGDALVLRGTPVAFAAVAVLFRVPADTETQLMPEPAGVGSSSFASSNGRIDDAAPSAVMASARPRGFTSRYPIDLERVYELKPAPRTAAKCSHLDRVMPVTPSAPGCEQCLASGDAWVHLRICMTCGHVGCCDSSKNKHATKHYHVTSHPIMRSLEPGENWGWCYDDRLTL